MSARPSQGSHRCNGHPPPALQITGCSSGLGRALALRLAAEREGGEPVYRVYATARNAASLKELEAAGCRCLALDVTKQARWSPDQRPRWAAGAAPLLGDSAALRVPLPADQGSCPAPRLNAPPQASVDAAVKKLLAEAGRIDVLVCNAGLSRVGPLVEQPMSEIEEARRGRRQRCCPPAAAAVHACPPAAPLTPAVPAPTPHRRCLPQTCWARCASPRRRPQA